MIDITRIGTYVGSEDETPVEKAPRPSDKYEAEYQKLRGLSEKADFPGYDPEQAKAARLYLKDQVDKFIQQHRKVEDFFDDKYKDQSEAAIRRLENYEKLQEWKRVLSDPNEAGRRYSAEISNKIKKIRGIPPQQQQPQKQPQEQSQQESSSLSSSRSENYISMDKFLVMSPQEGVVGKSNQGYTARWIKNDDGTFDLEVYSDDRRLANRAFGALSSYFSSHFREKVEGNKKTYEINPDAQTYMFNIGDDYFAVSNGKVKTRIGESHVWNTKEAMKNRDLGLYYVVNGHLIHPGGKATLYAGEDVDALNKNFAANMAAQQKAQQAALEKAERRSNELRKEWKKAEDDLIKSQTNNQGLSQDNTEALEKRVIYSYIEYINSKPNKTPDEQKFLDMVEGTAGQQRHIVALDKTPNGTYKYSRRGSFILKLIPENNQSTYIPFAMV